MTDITMTDEYKKMVADATEMREIRGVLKELEDAILDTCKKLKLTQEYIEKKHECDCGLSYRGNNKTHHKNGRVHKLWAKLTGNI